MSTYFNSSVFLIVHLLKLTFTEYLVRELRELTLNHSLLSLEGTLLKTFMHRNGRVTFLIFAHFVINLLIFRHLCVSTCPGCLLYSTIISAICWDRITSPHLATYKTNKITGRSLPSSFRRWDDDNTTHVFTLIISFNNDYSQQPRRSITTQQSQDGNEARADGRLHWFTIRIGNKLFLFATRRDVSTEVQEEQCFRRCRCRRRRMWRPLSGSSLSVSHR